MQRLLIFSIFLLLTSRAWAAPTNTSSVEIDRPEARASFSQTNYEASFTYSLRDNTVGNDDDLEADGQNFELKLGKVFHLSPKVSTSTLVGASMTNMDSPKGLDESAKSSRLLEFQVGQRLARNIYHRNAVVRPFLQAGAGLGEANVRFGSPATTQGKASFDYNYLYASLGVQVVFYNNVMALVQMQKNAGHIAGRLKASARNSAGTTFSQSSDVNGADKDVDSTSYSFGLGYLF